MTSIATPHEDSQLSDRELAALEALEDRMSRGTAVTWKEPRTIRGFLSRPIERDIEVKDYSDPSKTVKKDVATIRTASGLQAIWSGPSGLEKLFAVEGSGMPVIVVYVGEKISQSSGRTFKAFDIVIGEAPATTAGGGPAAESGIPFRPEAW